MRIDYISTYSLPSSKAVGIQIMNTCDGLAQAGNDVCLWIVKNEEDADSENIFEFYGLTPSFTIKTVTSKQKRTGKFSYIYGVLMYLREIKKQIRKDTVLYAREQIVGLIFPQYIFEVHALPKKWTWLHTILWNRARAFVVLTPFIQEFLINRGFSEEYILVAPDAISSIHLDASITKTEARKKYDIPLDKSVIAYVGKYKTPFAKGKGVAELISAFPFMQEKFPEAFLLLVGIDTKYKKEVESLVEQSKITRESVRIVGHVPQRDVPGYLRSADVLVMNYPWSEHHAYQMSPMKLYEYMAAERPVVASRLPSIEVELTNSNAFLIDPDNKEQLVAGVNKVLQDASFAESISREARRNVRGKTWQKRSEDIGAFIEKQSLSPHVE